MSCECSGYIFRDKANARCPLHGNCGCFNYRNFKGEIAERIKKLVNTTMSYNRYLEEYTRIINDNHRLIESTRIIRLK